MRIDMWSLIVSMGLTLEFRVKVRVGGRFFGTFMATKRMINLIFDF